MRLRHLLISSVLLVAAGCDSALDVDPVTVVPEDDAVIDAVSARAALAGAYDAMQSTSYYGEVMFTWGELSADNAQHSGTFTSYADADQAVITSDNGQVEGTWDAIYDAINRANVLIERIPGVGNLTQAEKDQMIGEALFIRALGYHDLVKLWGGVPIKTATVQSIEDASNISRATVAEVYTQILADLTQAEGLMSNNSDTRAGSIAAVRALRARAMLYRASPGSTGLNTADWAAVETAASAVIAMPGYSLSPTFSDLFSPNGADTDEDIFRLKFTDQDAFWAGYYFLVKTLGGRYEVAPTTSIRTAFEANDARGAWTIKADPARATRFYSAKFTTATGTEHPHVIRLAEMYLIRAEARARQNLLALAVADYNVLRARAGLAPHVLGVNVTTQAQVLAAIAQERRVELAFEGDRWPDLIRRGAEGLAVMVAHRGATYDPDQMLYPIPQNEIDVTIGPTGPRLTQNPGY
jgi:starch-binding outer membrane protein, SusD/RagB family